MVALGIFVLVELRAEEPILPMRLFRSRVFCIASALSFIVGFAMLGSLTFLPSYLQYVSGASATMSGVRMLPMVLGLLAHRARRRAWWSGSTGKYKPFPIAGAAVMAVGLYLLSTDGRDTSTLTQVDVHVRPRLRHRAGDAGADDRRAEHRRLPRPRVRRPPA